MISFIIIGRNEGWKLTNCLESVFKTIEENSLTDSEVIYVDSKSTDDSIARAKKFPQVKIFLVTGQCNAAIGRNIGAKEAKGDVLFFIDGDMEIISEFLLLVYDEKVGCIKIDVEGHEESVLIGAKQTLTRDHPSLIIEIEERHKPGSFKKVSAFLEKLGYKGFFFYNHHLEPITKFNISIHQNIDNKNKGGIYINNFLFIKNNTLDNLQNFI